MKSLLVYEEVPEATKFFIVDGDYRYLNGKFVNSDQELTDEEGELLADPEQSFGEALETPLTIGVFPKTDTVYVVHCGFFL